MATRLAPRGNVVPKIQFQRIIVFSILTFGTEPAPEDLVHGVAEQVTAEVGGTGGGEIAIVASAR